MIASRARPTLGIRLIKRALDRLSPMIRYRIDRDEHLSPWMKNSYAMSPEVVRLPPDAPFMTGSSCMARDFYHPEFHRLAALIGTEVHLHRKLWEWIFIVHHAYRTGAVRPGAQGLVFGVGRELLPGLFAAEGMRVTATDAPEQSPEAALWGGEQQHSGGLAGLPEGRLDRATFDARVEWRPCDMRAIDPALTGYDLVWSSCALEHLGSIGAGLDFIVDTVERCLAPGGVAIHTTELNLSSNRETIESGDTVLFRRADLEAVSDRLRAAGHMVDPLVIEPDSYVMDSFVDLPPYRKPHLRVAFGRFVTTSAGLVIRKRR